MNYSLPVKSPVTLGMAFLLLIPSCFAVRTPGTLHTAQQKDQQALLRMPGTYLYLPCMELYYVYEP